MKVRMTMADVGVAQKNSSTSARYSAAASVAAAKLRGARGHGGAGAADRIGLVVVGDAGHERRVADSAAGSPAGPVWSVQPKRGRKPTRPNTGFTCSSRARSASIVVVRQRMADHVR